MTITDPVPFYRAASNIQAHLLCGHLEQNGIDAHVLEDNPINGGWMFGLLPQVHKPEVCVDRRNQEQARSLGRRFRRRSLVRCKNARGAARTSTWESRRIRNPKSRDGSLMAPRYFGRLLSLHRFAGTLFERSLSSRGCPDCGDAPTGWP